MTVLFGTKEFFENELLTSIDDQQISGNFSDTLKAAYEDLNKDVTLDFICDKKVKIECLKNLELAYQKVLKDI
jgi:hypothetical protein